jgi:anti-sigma factor RsiW
MMDCGTFLDGYSEYRDDLLPLPERAAFEAHLRGCDSCARYDRVVAGGVRVLHSLPELEVSDDFMDRLQHRLWHVEDELATARRRRARPLRRTAAGAVAMAAAVGGVALLPQLPSWPAPTVTMLPSVSAAAPESGARGYRVASAPEATGEGLAARLEEVGVRVFPLPYRELVHHSAARVTLASYGEPLAHHSLD